MTVKIKAEGFKSLFKITKFLLFLWWNSTIDNHFVIDKDVYIKLTPDPEKEEIIKQKVKEYGYEIV